MAKIRYFNVFDILKLKKLVSHISDEKIISYNSFLLLYPIAVINNMLPLKLKFKADTFVAIQNGQIKALLTIKQRKHNYLKWYIKRLLLDENAHETGEQLINYVVAKFGASGAETIEVRINEKEQDIVDLFSKACGFRYCLDYKFYKLDYKKFKGELSDANTCIIRPYKSSDKGDLADLFNQNIHTFYKFPLSRSRQEFSESIFRGLYKTSLFKFVLEDRYSKQIRGYVQLDTADNKNYIIEVVILQSYENYFYEMISFAVSQIKKRTGDFSIYVKCYNFHQNFEEIEKQIKEYEGELIQTDMIFVKDFFKLVKDGNNLAKPAIIYNELKGRPAFETTGISKLN